MSKEITKTKLKIDDEVIVISGKSKGSKGKILAYNKKNGKIIVQGVNMKRRFQRPTQENPRGGLIKVEAPLHISSVQFFDSKSKKPSRIKYTQDKNGNKNKVRVAVKSGKEID